MLNWIISVVCNEGTTHGTYRLIDLVVSRHNEEITKLSPLSCTVHPQPDKLLHHIPSAACLWLRGVTVAPCGASLLLSIAIKSGFIQPAITNYTSCAACQMHSAPTKSSEVCTELFWNYFLGWTFKDWQKIWQFFFKGVKGFEYNRYATFPDVAPKHYCGRALKSLYVTGLLSNLHSCYILYDKGWEPRPKSCLQKHFFQAYARIRTLKITIIGKTKYNKQNMVVYLQTERSLPIHNHTATQAGSIPSVNTKVYPCDMVAAPSKWAYVCSSF